MTRRRALGWLLLAAVAAGAIAAVTVAARRAAREPARCAEGMTLLGARCCGEGQHLDAGRCTGAPRSCAQGLLVTAAGCAPPSPAVRVEIEGGTLTVAPADWEATGIVRPRRETVARFAVDAFEVDESRYHACVARAACPPLARRGEPGLPQTEVTAAEAARFCEAEGGRLPTEAELAFAAAGPGGRRYPWGPTGFVCRRAAWGLVTGPCAIGATGPEIVGAHPAGKSPEGVHDLSGNVAEWTQPDGQTAVVLGGSYRDVEAAALRTWSRGRQDIRERSPSVGFRCAYGVP